LVLVLLSIAIDCRSLKKRSRRNRRKGDCKGKAMNDCYNDGDCVWNSATTRNGGGSISVVGSGSCSKK